MPYNCTISNFRKWINYYQIQQFVYKNFVMKNVFLLISAIKEFDTNYQRLFQDRAHMYNIYPKFCYFRNKDHWWGLRSESKRLIVYNFLSYHFWTLKPIMNNKIVSNYYLRVDTSPILWILKNLFLKIRNCELVGNLFSEKMLHDLLESHNYLKFVKKR